MKEYVWCVCDCEDNDKIKKFWSITIEDYRL